jgi:hypothetical protein
MRILIEFNDNDFYFANMAFLKVLQDAFRHGHPRKNLGVALSVKEHIVEAYNATIYGLYLLSQNQWSYETAPHIKEYLQISIDNVYLDGEIEVLIAEKKFGNGEWFYLDVDHNQMECW